MRDRELQHEIAGKERVRCQALIQIIVTNHTFEKNTVIGRETQRINLPIDHANYI